LDKSIKRYAKVFPWYSGFTGDLLFYIAIDTLFLTVVKNFSAAQIVSLTSVSQLVCIALQFPVLFVIKKIGNTSSIRTGAFFLLMSSVFITFGNTYFLVLLGRIFHDIALIFKEASVVALENNLDLIDAREDFVRIRTSANTVYSVITMLIAFVASYMFNLNHYLPMFGCIATCLTGFVLSLFLKDCSDYNKISYKKSNKERVKIGFDATVILIIVAYSIFYMLVNAGQSEGKLFMQQEFLLDFDVDTTSLILGGIILVSRIIRVLSNLLFAKLYARYQMKMGVVLAVLLASAIGFILFGSLMPEIITKIIVMAVGYTIILFARDPFRLYIQDVLFMKTPKESHQTLLTMLAFGVKIGTAGTGLAFAAILLKYPMIVVISIIFAVAIIETILSIILYNKMKIKA